IDPARLVAYARDHFGANGAATGHCLYGNGQYAEAVAILAKVVQEAHPAGLIFHKYALAKAYQKLGKYELANLRLTEANQAFADEMAQRSVYNQWWTRLNLEMKRDEAEQLIYGKGRHRPAIDSLIARSEWQAALDRLEALGKDNELNSRDWTNRGRCQAELWQWEKALAAMDKAIALGADNYNAWFFKGQALSRISQYQKALADFERAEQVAQGPQSRIFHERAIAYNGLRQYDKALAAADRAIELGDSSPWLRTHRGSALAGSGKLPAAIEDFTRAAEGIPDQRTVFLINLAALHVANRDLAAYRQLCAKLFDEYKATDNVYNFNNLCWAMCFAPDAH